MPGLEGLSKQKSEGFRQKENMLCTDCNIDTKHMQGVKKDGKHETFNAGTLSLPSSRNGT